MAEGRFQRWSRLKRKGGGEARDEVQTEPARRRGGSAAPTVDGLPGGRLARSVVPPMPPLAAEAEDEDDRLTRGVGHVAEPGEADEPDLPTPTHPAVAADGLAEEAARQDLFAGIEERELTEEEKAVVAGLPPVETLTKESDFTPFLRAGVPDFLKRKALRMLWRSDPFFNFRDGMNEYDDDYNILHKVISEITGKYQVGRGHLSEEELRKMTPERARKAFGMDEDLDEAEAAPDDEPAAPDREPTVAASGTSGQEDAPAPEGDTGEAGNEKARGGGEATDDAVGDGEDDPHA